MDDLKTIASKLITAKNILLYPHVGTDGDAIGSCVAIAKALRKMGKKAYALYADEIPHNLEFMITDEQGEPYFTDDPEIIADSDLDVSMAVDCGGWDRFRPYEEKFRAAKTTLCLDHHGTSIFTEEDGSTHGIADFSVIDPKAAATGILVFDLLKELEPMTSVSLIPDKEIGEALFAAITTDTGNFQYSNTNRKCYEVMAEISDWNVDTNKVSVEIYENVRLEEVRIKSLAMDHMTMVSEGKGAISYVSREDLLNIGVREGETDSVVNVMRSIGGVEIVAFLKEKDHDTIRVSFRSKSDADVAAIAKAHDGGGHRKAAGCTLYMPIEEAVELISREVEEALKEL
ncbi:MAG: bifunctional oligoribonuclease/PAP phosphatase NrnA [Firmicutes bacterium]|nr:bifunctional oligoribonuclease/PAP phosphatase NrnA [Bacillota bacterium]